MRIDVHGHYYPNDVARRMHALGSTFNPPTAGSVLDARVDMLEAAGIDHQVLCLGGLQGYLGPRPAAIAAAQAANDAFAEAIAGYGGRFLAFGSVPLPHVDAAITETARCLDELGCVGIQIGCSIADLPLDDVRLEPFWREIDRREAVVFLHPMGAGGPFTDNFGLKWMLGACYEDTTVALRLAMSGLLDRHRRARIVVPHLGGTLPFLWQRIRDHLARPAPPGETVAPDPMAALKRLYYDTVNGSGSALRSARDLLGADRLLFGTDFPHCPPVDQCVRYVETAGLDHDELALVFGGTAQGILRLRT